jgi:hypothetical protein
MKALKIIIVSFFSISLCQAKDFNCIEVNLFSVDRDNISTRAYARAASIPEETLNILQVYVRNELSIDHNGLKAVKGGEQKCENPKKALVLDGTISDYKKGSQVMRYMVGFGAGKQKIQIEAVLKNKSTNSIIKRDRVVDRKIGGLIGGSDNKGKRDFAEKMNNFVRTGLGMKKSKL